MIILDMDSSVKPTHGEQEGTAYNGHFGCTCYHRPVQSSAIDVPCAPVMFTVPTMAECSGAGGDALCGCIFVAMPFGRRYTNISKPITLRHASKRTRFSSGTLQHLLRPVGRSPARPCSPFPRQLQYQAGSWNKIAVSWPKWSGTRRAGSSRGFIVTNRRPTKRVVAFYNHRGTAEQHIKEGKNAINWTRLSMSQVPQQCRSAPASRPGLQSGQLHALALPKEVEHSMTTLRESW